MSAEEVWSLFLVRRFIRWEERREDVEELQPRAPQGFEIGLEGGIPTAKSITRVGGHYWPRVP